MKETGGGFTGAELVGNAELWDVLCDTLIPGALEGQITAARARRVTATLVLEGADVPTTSWPKAAS